METEAHLTFMIRISQFIEKRPPFLIGGFVFGVALLMQIVFCADYYFHSPFYSGLICDSKVYYKWAENILRGDWFGREVFHQAPLYPYFIALVWSIFGRHYLAVYLVQAFMMALSVLLVFLITRRLMSADLGKAGTDSLVRPPERQKCGGTGCPALPLEQAALNSNGAHIPEYNAAGGNVVGLVAGLICAFYGTLNFYALKILPDMLGVFLHLWLAYLLLKAVAPRQWLSAGFVCGLLILARPQVLLLLPMVLVWMLCLRAPPLPALTGIAPRLKQFGCFILPVIILVGLTAWRNYTIEPGLVLVSSCGGETFFGSNNPKADGIYCRLDGVSPDIEQEKTDVKKVAEAEMGRKLTSAQVSNYWLARGLAFIRNNFPAYLRLEAVKFKRIFSGTEYANMYFLWFERTEFTKTFAVPAVHFYLILPFAVIGAVLFAGEWRKYGLLYIMILLTVLNMLIFFVDERYRLPMIPFLIILGTGGAFRLAETLRAGSRSRLFKLGVSALAIAALFVTIHLYRTEPARLAVAHQLRNNLGEVYYEKGEYEKALKIFYKSSQMAVNNWEAEMGVAKALFALGKKDLAVRLYREAFPNLDKEIRESCLRDRDLDALRSYAGASDEKAGLGPERED